MTYRRTSLPGADAMRATSDWSFPRHTHDQYGLGMMLSGGHRSSSDRRTVTAVPAS